MSVPEISAAERGPLVQVRELSKEYVQRRAFTRERFTIRAFQDVTLAIARGTTLGLAGESGSGKSSLVRCLALIEAPSRGEIWFEGEQVIAREREAFSQIRRQVQVIFQDASTALNPRLTAAEIVAEPLAIQREGTKPERRRRAAELMEQAGLPATWVDKRSLEFSGGQRQRLAIARALALQPKLLIFDEALSHLDLANQDMMLELLARLRQEHGLTYVHVSHDLQMLSGIADQIAVMCEGQIVECNSAEKVFAHPQHAYTQELVKAMPALEAICAERLARNTR